MNKINKVVIFHGTGNNAQGNWFPWLAENLRKKGIEVWVPNLPESEKPNGKLWLDFVISETKANNFVFDEQTVVVGHSAGAVLAIHLLNNLSEGKKLGGVYLVSAFDDDLGWEKLDKLFSTLPAWNYEKIREKVDFVKIIHSDDDPYIPLEQAIGIADGLLTGVIVYEDSGHFNLKKSEEFRRFPELLAMILEEM